MSADQVAMPGRHRAGRRPGAHPFVGVVGGSCGYRLADGRRCGQPRQRLVHAYDPPVQPVDGRPASSGWAALRRRYVGPLR